jgi:hypothetical protein
MTASGIYQAIARRGRQWGIDVTSRRFRDTGLDRGGGLTAPFVLNLVEARSYADGAVLHVYRPPVSQSTFRGRS